MLLRFYKDNWDICKELWYDEEGLSPNEKGLKPLERDLMVCHLVKQAAWDLSDKYLHYLFYGTP